MYWTVVLHFMMNDAPLFAFLLPLEQDETCGIGHWSLAGLPVCVFHSAKSVSRITNITMVRLVFCEIIMVYMFFS